MSSTYKYKILVGGTQKFEKIPFLDNSEFEERDFIHIGISIKPIECMTNCGDSYLFIFWALNRAKRFEFMTSSFCYGARGALLYLDISDSKSINDVNYWIKSIRSSTNNISIILLIYQSNVKQKEVLDEEINKIINNNDLEYFILSSYRKKNHKEKKQFFKFLIQKLSYESPIYMDDFSIFFPIEEKRFLKFSNFYSLCPICKNKNHIYNLKEFYFSKNPNLLRIREKFLEIHKKFNCPNNFSPKKIKCGILCCTCYNKYYKN